MGYPIKMRDELDAKTVAAVEQACRSDIIAYGSLGRFVLEIPDDREDACTRYGSLTPTIAALLNWPLAKVRSRLQRLSKAGKVMREDSDARGGCVRWWVPGLLAKLKAEKDQA